MIAFRHPLPAMNVEGRQNGSYNNEELVLPSVLTTTDHRLGDFMHDLQNAVRDDRRLVFIDGKVLMCSKNWIRDHVHEMKAFMHWDYNLASFLEFILETQREDGQFFELIKQMDDPHWRFVSEDCYRLYPADNLSLVRLELEADVEYLVVEGARQYYRVTGDLDWVRRFLPRLEKGIYYVLSDKKRFDDAHGLAIRPLTIDTWDFTDDSRSHEDRRIHPGETMAAMHGDNTGLYQAMCQLAFFRRKLGDEAAAAAWETRAEALKTAIFRYLWNGRFFVHQFPVNGPATDENEAHRLSLSNAYALNRGILTLAQSRAVIDEYRRRRQTTSAFAEWFTIDPPYASFCDYGPGEYVNGAISPFTAGELAKAAFSCGCESYGWDILSRFMSMMERDKAIYFLYSPRDSLPQGGGPSAWGAAALLSAVDEGLAGVVDEDAGYRTLRFSPRFPITGYTELRYFTGYEMTAAYVDIRYILTEQGLRYDLISPAETVHAHLLLPSGTAAKAVLADGVSSAFTPVCVGDSHYVDLTLFPKDGRCSLEVLFA